MAQTYVPIASTTLGSAAASFTFSSIPSTYTDLRIICVPGSTVGPTDMNLQFNGDTGSNYSATLLRGDGSSAISARNSNQVNMSWMSYINTTLAVAKLDIMNYSNTTTYKTVISRGDLSSDFVNGTVGLWRNTAAITSITLNNSGGNFTTGSTFSLYGILAA